MQAYCFAQLAMQLVVIVVHYTVNKVSFDFIAVKLLVHVRKIPLTAFLNTFSSPLSMEMAVKWFYI